MARGFRIHSNAVFNPFSYQELLAPIQDYQQAYDQMQDAMLAAGEEANQYKQLIDTDEYASGILQGYNDALAEMSGKLSSEGLKTINRNSLLSLRRRYNNEVKPINDAAKTLAGLQDMYRQAYAKDNTLMRGAMPSIRDLVENPGAMPQMVSGNDLYKQGAQAAQSASARIYNTDFGNRINGYIQQVAEQGYSPELVAQFIQDASSIPELARDMQNIRQMYNTQGLEDRGYKADQYIMQGILDGINYQRKENYVDDWQAKLATQFSYQQKAADAAYQRQADLATLKASLKSNGTGTTGSGARVNYNNVLKAPVYIDKDGVVHAKDAMSTEAFEAAQEGHKYSSTTELTSLPLDYKVNILALSGLIPDDFINSGTLQYDEDKVNSAIRENIDYIRSVVDIYASTKNYADTDKWFMSKGHVKSKDRTENEVLIVPRTVRRETQSPYGSYGVADDDYSAYMSLIGGDEE